MKIFVQFPRKDIFSFKCKYCFNILSKAHENICALKPSPQTIFRSSSVGRLCVMQHCAWTRGHAGTRGHATLGHCFLGSADQQIMNPSWLQGGILSQRRKYFREIQCSQAKNLGFVCTSRWKMEGLLHPEFLAAVHPIYLLEAEDNIPPCMTLETCCRQRIYARAGWATVGTLCIGTGNSHLATLVLTRASNEGSRRFHNHREGPYFWFCFHIKDTHRYNFFLLASNFTSFYCIQAPVQHCILIVS